MAGNHARDLMMAEAQGGRPRQRTRGRWRLGWELCHASGGDKAEIYQQPIGGPLELDPQANVIVRQRH